MSEADAWLSSEAAWRLQAAFLLFVLVANIRGAWLVAWDKHRARHGGRRVPERRLVLWSFLGGWPAMAAAMLVVRHKVRKVRFLLWFGAAAVPSALAYLTMAVD